MHPRYASILRCPYCSGPLDLRVGELSSCGMVISGTLQCGCGTAYPILRGVPRFVDSERYASSFGFEWQRWPRVQFDSENIGGPMQGHTTRMFERIIGIDTSGLNGKMIVDFGCGPGRFLDVLRRKGAVAVGMDLSVAVDAARANFLHDPEVLIVQADLARPPFARGAFDGGYSIGVLHHTPDPAGGLAALVDCVRPDGWVACCVYPKNDFYDFASVRRLRKLNERLHPWLGYRFALLYCFLAAYVLAPVSSALRRVGLARFCAYMERNWIVVLRLKDARWRVLDIFDAITPAIATTHATKDVHDWMHQAGCRAIARTSWCSTSVVGFRKRPETARAA